MNSQENIVDTDDLPEAEAAATGGDADAHNADPVEALRAQLAAAEQKAGDNWERCLRTAAELDNARKRAARDLENANKFAIERFAREILGVRDALEMALQAAHSDEHTLKAHVDGTRMTLKTLDQALEKFGVVPINPEGEKFDPERHEAMSAIPSEDAESGSVHTVVQKGFELNGRLLRAARVFVVA